MMANAKKCDRCGVYSDEYEHPKWIKICDGNEVRFFELCDKCYEKVLEVLEQQGETT